MRSKQALKHIKKMNECDSCKNKELCKHKAEKFLIIAIYSLGIATGLLMFALGTISAILIAANNFEGNLIGYILAAISGTAFGTMAVYLSIGGMEDSLRKIKGK